MQPIKTTVTKVKNNPLATLAGAGAGFLIARKMKVTNKYYIAGAILAGAVVAAFTSSYVKQTKSTPKASIK
jgi:hypothetical protein